MSSKNPRQHARIIWRALRNLGDALKAAEDDGVKASFRAAGSLQAEIDGPAMYQTLSGLSAISDEQLVVSVSKTEVTTIDFEGASPDAQER